MPKKVNQKELINIPLWLDNKITVADLARAIKCNPRSNQVYTRIAITLRYLHNLNK